jgi:hypothetical protein
MEFHGAALLYCVARRNAVTGAGSEMLPSVSMTWSFNVVCCFREKQRKTNVMVSLSNHLTDPAV